MINSKKDLKEYLDYEYKKYFKNKSKFKVWLISKFNIGEKYVIWNFQRNLRKYEYHLNTNHKVKKIFYKIKVARLSNKYGLNISPNCFDKGLKIMHLGSILVNGGAKIGSDCSIHINTCIVAGGNNHASPKIGNQVIIGVGSIILGDIDIGDNCVIGAGAVVNKSFSNNVTIAGVPAKIISNSGSDTWLNINK